MLSTTLDPENRLVAAELEREWNNALSKVGEFENEIALLEQESKIVSEQERQSILSLSDDLPFVWNHGQSNPEIKSKTLAV